MKIKQRTFIVIAVLLAQLVLRAGSVTNEFFGAVGNLAFETSPLMRDCAHADQQNLPAGWQKLSGAIALNAKWETNDSLPWFIEYQKEGRDWITAATHVVFGMVVAAVYKTWPVRTSRSTKPG